MKHAHDILNHSVTPSCIWIKIIDRHCWLKTCKQSIRINILQYLSNEYKFSYQLLFFYHAVFAEFWLLLQIKFDIIPTVVLTFLWGDIFSCGWATWQLVDKVLEKGKLEYLEKPFTVIYFGNNENNRIIHRKLSVFPDLLRLCLWEIYHRMCG